MASAPNGAVSLPSPLLVSTSMTSQSRVPRPLNSPDNGYFSSELNGFHLEEPSDTQSIFHDSRTSLILKRIYFKLLSQTEVDISVVRMFNVEHRIARTDSDKRFIMEFSDKFVEYVQHSKHTSIEVNLKDFHTQQWRIDSTNMYAEFKKVSNETFRGRKHWGKVVGFITFAVAYAIYVHSKGIRDAVISVEAWTRQVIEEDVGEFFIQNGGWVSECLCVYMEDIAVL